MSSYPELYGPYKDHFPCFHCRKVFKPRQALPYRDVMKCPECGDTIRNYGLYFKAPPRNNVSAWKALQKSSRPKQRCSLPEDLTHSPMHQQKQYDASLYETIYELIPLLDNPIISKRENTRQKLLEIGQPTVIPLIEVLQNSAPDFPSGIQPIIEILGNLQDGLAISSIIPALKSNSTPVCIAAVVALGKLRSEKAIPMIIDLVRTPLSQPFLDRQRRIAICDALARMDVGRKIMPFLSDDNPDVRQVVITALSHMSSRRNLVSEIIKALEVVLDDPTTTVRQEADLAIRRIRQRNPKK